MTDPWWWGALGGAVGVGSLGRELVGFVMRLLSNRTDARKTDSEVAGELRDALLLEIARLRDRVDRLEQRADGLDQELRACEERSFGLERENERLRVHAETLASRVSQLEDRA